MTGAGAARPAGGHGWGELVESVRELLDVVASANPPDGDVLRAAGEIRRTAALLGRHRVREEHETAAMHRHDLPGIGHPNLVPFLPRSKTSTEVHGTVVFRRTHLGGGGAAHGGHIPLLFDDVLGQLAANGRTRSRTAYLNVAYRSIAVVGRELQVEGTIEREEGRKLFARGRLLDGGTTVAEAEALFVLLRPGQP